MDDLAQARLQREMDAMRIQIQEVTKTADSAAHSISTHEQICALRYENIAARLEDIPRLFGHIGSLQKHVYIGMGIVLVIGTLAKYVI
jgi:hypothetical protein